MFTAAMLPNGLQLPQSWATRRFLEAVVVPEETARLML